MKIMEIFEANPIPQPTEALTDAERAQLLNLVRNHTKTLADNPNTDINTLDFWDNILTKLS